MVWFVFSCVRRLENARNGSDRSYHVWSGLIERASSFLSWFRHDMSQTSDPLLAQGNFVSDARLGLNLNLKLF